MGKSRQFKSGSAPGMDVQAKLSLDGIKTTCPIHRIAFTRHRSVADFSSHWLLR